MIIPATHIVTPAETTPAPRHIYYPGEHLVSTPQASTHAMEYFLPLLVGLLSLLFPSRSWPLSLPRFYRQSLGTIGAEFLHGMVRAVLCQMFWTMLRKWHRGYFAKDSFCAACEDMFGERSAAWGLFAWLPSPLAVAGGTATSRGLKYPVSPPSSFV